MRLLPSPWNDDVTKFLPSSAGVAVSAHLNFPNLLTPLMGLVVLLAYALLTLLVTTVILDR